MDVFRIFKCYNMIVLPFSRLRFKDHFMFNIFKNIKFVSFYQKVNIYIVRTALFLDKTLQHQVRKTQKQPRWLLYHTGIDSMKQ